MWYFGLNTNLLITVNKLKQLSFNICVDAIQPRLYCYEHHMFSGKVTHKSLLIFIANARGSYKSIRISENFDFFKFWWFHFA